MNVIKYIERRFLPLVLVPLAILFIGLRFKVGPDFFNYTEMFNELSLRSSGNIIFNIIAFSFKSLGFNFQITFLIYAFFTSIGIMKLASLLKTGYKNQIFIFVIIFLAILPSSLNIIRQAAAIPFLLIATFYLSKNNLKTYIFYSVVATLLHKTSIILVILSPLYICNKRIKHNNSQIIVISSILVLTTFIDVSGFINQVLSYSKATLSYTTMGRFSAKANDSARWIISFKMFLLVILAILVNKVKNINNNEKQVLIKAILLCSVFLALSVQINILGRLYLFYRPLIALAMTLIIFNTLKNKNIGIVSSVFASVLLCLMSLYTAYKKESAMRHYSINFCLFDKPCPQNFFGEHEKAKRWTQ